MKRTHWIVMMIVAVGAAAMIGANGLKPGPSKVAVCDIRRVVVEYNKFQQLQQQMQQEEQQVRARMTAMKEELEKLVEEMQMLKPGSDEFMQRSRTNVEKTFQAQAYQKNEQIRLQMLRRQGVLDCYSDVLNAVETYCRENAIDAVFAVRDINLEQAGSDEEIEAMIVAKYVLYHEPGVDITNAVLARLNN